MKEKAITIAALVGSAVLLIGWDIWLYYNAPDGMISRVILDTAKDHPVLPMLFGVLCGHFFWPQKPSGDTP